MKEFLIIVLITCSLTSFSQNLKTKLQGDWVCIAILDSSGDSTEGKFGASNEYLRFRFRKGYISFNKSPVDNSLEIPIKYKKDYFEFANSSRTESQGGLQLYDRNPVPNTDINIPERRYFVDSISDKMLILSTLDSNGESIYYHLVNQKSFYNLLNDNSTIDIGYVIVKHIKTSKDSQGANRVAEYIVSNREENLYPSPIFSDYSNSSFGHFVSINFVFPKTHKIGVISEELIVDFLVDNKGAVSDIKIIKGIGVYYDATIMEIIAKTKKKWKPIRLNNELVSTTIRAHFIFYLDVVDLGF
jgi:hypothetical protein